MGLSQRDLEQFAVNCLEPPHWAHPLQGERYSHRVYFF